MKDVVLRNVRYQLDHWKNRKQYGRLRKSEGQFSLRGFDELRCVFVHVPKAGGTSISEALFGNSGGGHRSVRQYKRILGPLTYNRYFSFTIVRNPFSRVVSAYTYLKRGGRNANDRAWAEKHLKGVDTFTDFVLNRLDEEVVWSYYHFKPQCHFICEGNGVVGVDFIGRFERMEDDFHEICRRLKVEANLGHHNPTGRKRDYTSYYDPVVMARVAEVYCKDFQVLGYHPTSLGG